MLEASHRQPPLMRKFDISADTPSSALGSIRSPAANNGLYGFKPTAFRVPTDGWSSIMAGADTISSVVGPLCASLGGIALFMKVIIDAKPWLSEPALIPMPWNSNAQISPNHPLKIGVLTHDGVVTPHPPITNTLNAVVAKLKKLSGVSIIPWKPHLHDEAWAIISSLYFADAGEADASVMAESGEPWRPLTKWIIKENPCVKNLSTGELAYWQEEREIYRKEYSNAWNATATGQNKDTGALEGLMDVILCPAGPGVAPSHNTAKYWGYTSQWNLLDYPAVVFPVAKSDKNVDRPDKYKPMSGADLDHWALCKNFGSPNGDALADLKLQYKTDSPEKFEKLPIALQLVGRRFEDEKVLGILDYITRSIGLPFGKFP